LKIYLSKQSFTGLWQEDRCSSWGLSPTLLWKQMFTFWLYAVCIHVQSATTSHIRKVMVFNATVNNISVISCWSILLVEETDSWCVTKELLITKGGYSVIW